MGNLAKTIRSRSGEAFLRPKSDKLEGFNCTKSPRDNTKKHTTKAMAALNWLEVALKHWFKARICARGKECNVQFQCDHQSADESSFEQMHDSQFYAKYCWRCRAYDCMSTPALVVVECYQTFVLPRFVANPWNLVIAQALPMWLKSIRHVSPGLLVSLEMNTRNCDQCAVEPSK